MTSEPEPTPLIAHTLDTLCDELVSGRGVVVGDDEVFRLPSQDVRAVFRWYYENRTKWAGRNMTEDVEAIVGCLAMDPLELPPTTVAVASAGATTIHLKTVKIHRFAGIQDYCTPEGQAPPVFNHEFTRQLTVIEGANAAGKTSLLSAICWCLTGYVYRSQRPPEAADARVQLGFADTSETEDPDQPAHDVSPITPIPPAKVRREIGDARIPLDTWVELSFVGANGLLAGTVRRSLSRSRAGKVIDSVTGLAELKVDPIAIEVGTRMPGLLPYIRLDEASDLGKAVAALTGFRPLRDLVKDAEKSSKKLRGGMPESRRQVIAGIGESYRGVRAGLVVRLEERPEIKPEMALPEISDGKITASLKSLADHFETLRTEAYGDGKVILGETFDASDTKAIEKLGTAVAQARGLIEPDALARHSTTIHVQALDGVTAEQFGAVEALVATTRSQAAELAELHERPDIASRITLYTRVAQWLRDESGGTLDLSVCPVCGVSLAGKKDEVTEELIADHLAKLAAEEADHLGMTLEAWATAAKDRLTSDLPKGLKECEKQRTVDDPRALVKKGVCDELFTASAFTGVLSPLKTGVTGLCERVVAALPVCAVPERIELPECFGKGSRLEIVLNGVMRAIAFARWTQKTREARQDAVKRVIGLTREEGEGEDIELVSSSPLGDRLEVLHNVIRRAAPLHDALKDLAAMSGYVKGQAAEGAKIRLYERAAKAIDQLQTLDRLVDIQVGSLVSKLSARTREWKDLLYHAASMSAPRVVKTDVGENGSLPMEAEARGTTASAHHICNKSDLRATLLAFLLAFREQVNEKRGGLSLLLLDDPQELFDRPNRERVAACMSGIAASGARVILTTNDEPFRKQLVLV